MKFMLKVGSYLYFMDYAGHRARLVNTQALIHFQFGFSHTRVTKGNTCGAKFVLGDSTIFSLLSTHARSQWTLHIFSQVLRTLSFLCLGLLKLPCKISTGFSIGVTNRR